MTQRESQQLWLKDVLEHLQESQEQLAWMQDPDTTRLLLEGMVRDLECGKQLCESLKARLQQRSGLVRCS